MWEHSQARWEQPGDCGPGRQVAQQVSMSQEELESRTGKRVAAGDPGTLTADDGSFFSPPPERRSIEHCQNITSI